MKKKKRMVEILFRALMATVLFTLFQRIVLFTGWVDVMVARGWSLLAIQAAAASLEFLFAGVVVILIMPRILRLGSPPNWLPEFLSADVKGVMLGVLSFVVFGLLGVIIAKILGIYVGDPSVIFAWPDIRPDPDVVGFGYFLLSLVPGVWEELAFRGLVLSRFQKAIKPWPAVLLSAFFFALFHLSNLITQPPSAAIGGVIMSFFFGIVWGLMTVRTGSVIPAMLSHYLVDSMGMVFLNVDMADPAKGTLFFLLLVISFVIVNIMLTTAFYPSSPKKQTAKGQQMEKKGV